MDVISALIILGVIMVLGFIGNFIFNRTQIPSIVWLLLFGFVVGAIFKFQTFQLYYPELLMTISGFFGAIAIVIILFDGGINTDIYQLFKGAPRGLLLTGTGFFISFFATILVVSGLHFAGIIPIQGDSYVVGAVLGAIIGGTSSPIVIPLVCKLKNLSEKTKMVLSIESILTDPLCIVVIFAIYYMIFVVGEINIGLGIGNLVKTFSVGIVLGFSFGFIWLFIMNKLRKEQFSYVLTLAVVFLVYSFTSLIVGVNEGGEGAGAIACLMFGLVLGNGKKVLKMVNYEGEGFETRLARISSETPKLAVSIWNGILHGPAIYNLITAPPLLDVMEAIVGPEIIASSVYRLRPKIPNYGYGEVPWHQDSAYFEPFCDEHLILTAWVPLVDANENNGCLYVIPGSHKNKVVEHQSHASGKYLEIREDLVPGENWVACPVNRMTCVSGFA